MHAGDVPAGMWGTYACVFELVHYGMKLLVKIFIGFQLVMEYYITILMIQNC